MLVMSCLKAYRQEVLQSAQSIDDAQLGNWQKNLTLGSAIVDV